MPGSDGDSRRTSCVGVGSALRQRGGSPFRDSEIHRANDRLGSRIDREQTERIQAGNEGVSEGDAVARLFLQRPKARELLLGQSSAVTTSSASSSSEKSSIDEVELSPNGVEAVIKRIDRQGARALS